MKFLTKIKQAVSKILGKIINMQILKNHTDTSAKLSINSKCKSSEKQTWTYIFVESCSLFLTKI